MCLRALHGRNNLVSTVNRYISKFFIRIVSIVVDYDKRPPAVVSKICLTPFERLDIGNTILSVWVINISFTLEKIRNIGKTAIDSSMLCITTIIITINIIIVVKTILLYFYLSILPIRHIWKMKVNDILIVCINIIQINIILTCQHLMIKKITIPIRTSIRPTMQTSLPKKSGPYHFRCCSRY